MSEFETIWKNYIEKLFLNGITPLHIIPKGNFRNGYVRALEWVLQKGESCNYINEPWDDIKKELKIIENE